MFLSSLHDTNAFTFGADGAVSARQAAIEAELRHLPKFTGSDICVDIEGNCIVLTGAVRNHLDYYRAMNVATDIAGAEKVIFRVSCSAPLAS